MAAIKEIWRILSLPCRDATALMSQAMDAPLPRHLRLAVWLHQRVCSGCRAYRRQLRAMRAALARLAKEGLEPGVTSAAPMPAQVRERIKRALSPPHQRGGAPD